MPRRLITERHVLDAAAAGRTELAAPPGTLVTALGRHRHWERAPEPLLAAGALVR